MADWNDMILVGRIARAHGLRGDVVVNPDTDFVDQRFRPGEALWMQTPTGEERLTIASARVQQGRPVVRFEGFDGIEAVERLAGRELRIAADAVQPLDAGTFYHHQLTGCLVETVGGDVVGTVMRVDGGPGSSRLVIEGHHGEVLVPLADDICVVIDVEGKRIRIDPPEGLIDLNETRGDRP